MKRKMLTFLLLLALAMLLIIACVCFPQVAALAFAAAALAYLLRPPVRCFTEVRVPVLAAVLIVYGIAGMVLLFLALVLVPDLSGEAARFAADLPAYMYRLERVWSSLQARFETVFFYLGWEDVTASETLERAASVLGRGAADYLLTLPQIFVFLVLTPVVAYYFLRDSEKIAACCLDFFPPRQRSVVLTVAQEINGVLRGFIRGNLTVALIIAVATAAGLALLSVPYALILGLLAGLLNIIPYFGPLLGALPILAVALLQDDVSIVLVIIFLFLLQQVDGMFITPKVMGESVGMHPVAIILLVLIGGSLGGLAGMILIIPLAAVISVLAHRLYEHWVAGPSP